MYCGDDVNAIVGDVGTHYSKFGLAGEDSPSILIPSVVGYRYNNRNRNDIEPKHSVCAIGDGIFSTIPQPSHIDVKHPIQSCIVQDWDALENIWEDSFKKLYINPQEHPVLTSRVSIIGRSQGKLINHSNGFPADPKDTETYMEMMFEKFQTPAFYIASDAVLSAFAFGRPTAFVIDIGAGAARAVPVFDGYPLHESAQFNASLGMNTINFELEKTLMRENPQLQIQPRCFFESMETKVRKSEDQLAEIFSSYSQFMKMEIVRDIRESLCAVSDTQGSIAIAKRFEATESKIKYELPDGTSLAVGKERYIVPEIFFSAKMEENEATLPSDSSLTQRTLHEMVYKAVKLCDPDLRRDMLSTIILCGGGSLTPGLMERLHAELSLLIPSSFKLRILNMTRTERRLSNFIGGSILASLGSFQQMWISRSQYEEFGAASICAKYLS